MVTQYVLTCVVYAQELQQIEQIESESDQNPHMEKRPDLESIEKAVWGMKVEAWMKATKATKATTPRTMKTMKTMIQMLWLMMTLKDKTIISLWNWLPKYCL